MKMENSTYIWWNIETDSLKNKEVMRSQSWHNVHFSIDFPDFPGFLKKSLYFANKNYF